MPIENLKIRERTEEKEEALSPLAAKSRFSKGREKPEEPCPIRTAFQRDRDRIIHSNSFRRLKHKTQVFIAPTGDHYVTRLTHTLEVSQIARKISRALNLNEDLTEAIALGHDLGHTPFGHIGEDVLDELFPGGFKHNEQSRRVVDLLEKNGQGLLIPDVAMGLSAAASEKRGSMAARVERVTEIVAADPADHFIVWHDLEDERHAKGLRRQERRQHRKDRLQ